MKKVSVAIIEHTSQDEKRYTLVASKRDFGEYTHFYAPPGGHVEAGETTEEAVIRECNEELGIILENPVLLCESPGDVKNQMTYWYTASINTTELIVDYGELQAAGFFSLEELRTMNLWPATRKIFEEYYGL